MTPVPSDILPGKHRLVVVIDGQVSEPPRGERAIVLPVHDVGLWRSGLSLQREALYGDDGR